jgi:hypothetical protein
LVLELSTYVVSQVVGAISSEAVLSIIVSVDLCSLQSISISQEEKVRKRIVLNSYDILKIYNVSSN